MNKLILKSITGFFKLIIFLGLMIFLPNRSFHYWQGWLYLFVFSLPVLITTIYLLKYDRPLIERRLKAGPIAEKEKSQKIIQSLAGLTFVGLMVFSVLDHRYHWMNVPYYLSLISIAGIWAGFYLMFLVFKENSFASGTITVEENQKLISTGPYSVVRHPMYSGVLLLFISTPLLLGSFFGLLFSGLLIALFIFRIINEEQYLDNNLPGYKEYRRKVKYRILPYIL